MSERCGIGSGGWNQNRKVRVAVRAGSQFGCIGVWQLRRMGIGKATINRWARAGYLHPRLPGVYSVGHTAPSVEAALSEAIIYAGEGAMLSHATALWWYGILDRRPAAIDVSTAGHATSLRGVRVHARRRLERRWHNGLPVTSAAQALLDFAAAAPLSRVRYALAQAEYHQLLDLDEVFGVLGRGRPGSANLRSALQQHLPQLARTRSEMERVFLPLCERGGIPLPQVNVLIGRDRVDAVWRDARVVVELDGLRGHRTKAQIERDRRRDLRLRAAGYTVLRYTWEQITAEPELVLADLRRALGLTQPAQLAARGSR